MNDRDGEKATAAYSGLSVALLRKRRILGLPPPYIKVGRRVLYSRSEIDRFLAQHTVHPRTVATDINEQSQPAECGPAIEEPTGEGCNGSNSRGRH